MSQKIIKTESGDGISSKSADSININLDDTQDSKQNEGLGVNMKSNQSTNSPTNSVHGSQEEFKNQATKENLNNETIGYE